MKKFITAILAVLYLGTSMGATVHLHYCMGKLVSWGLIDHGNKRCTFCGMSKKTGDTPSITKKNCCKDEHKLVRSDKDQKTTPADLQWAQCTPAAYGPSLPDIHVTALTISDPKANAPPLIGQIPLFLRNRNFRI